MTQNILSRVYFKNEILNSIKVYGNMKKINKEEIQKVSGGFASQTVSSTSDYQIQFGNKVDLSSVVAVDFVNLDSLATAPAVNMQED
ncbi:hypothetical protein [Motilimonas eburnea]|uniref:hypothetical protein n=1 Tax=Motilimonas eburnea TaxID=1737488 RepID=UPI001E631617|nr:hypothetical protein [Motilimonas eburnea]MCE2571812.1 hypothetical protein [Motilimonas eburnea]